MWFSYTMDDKGLPAEVTIEHFVPIHLGSSGYTEWKDTIMAPHMDRMLSDTEIGDRMLEWVRGNVHSHHNMTAGFSSTDSENILLVAPMKEFYFSLIVNHARPWGFGYSYRDDYGNPHWYKIEHQDFVPKPDAGMDVFIKEMEARRVTELSKTALRNHNVYHNGNKLHDNPMVEYSPNAQNYFGPQESFPFDMELLDEPIIGELDVFIDDHGQFVNEAAMDIFRFYKKEQITADYADNQLIDFGYTLKEMEGYERDYIAQSI